MNCHGCISNPCWICHPELVKEIVNKFESNPNHDKDIFGNAKHDGPFRDGILGIPRINYSWWARNAFPIEPLPPAAKSIYFYQEMPDSKKMIEVKQVTYEISIKSSKAAYGRFGRAILVHNVRVIDTLWIGSKQYGTPVVMVEAPLPRILSFIEDVKPYSAHYRSPTLFDEGALISIYKSAEDEILDKKTQRAIEILQRNILLFGRDLYE